MLTKEDVIQGLIDDLRNLPVYQPFQELSNLLNASQNPSTPTDYLIKNIGLTLKTILKDYPSDGPFMEEPSYGLSSRSSSLPSLIYINCLEKCYEELRNNKLTSMEKKQAIYHLSTIINSATINSHFKYKLWDRNLGYSAISDPEIVLAAFIRNPFQFHIICNEINQAIIHAPSQDRNNSPTDSTRFKIPSFIKRHWLALTLSTSTGLLVGITLGVFMGVVLAIPTGGLSLLATPWAIAILGGAGLVISGLIGTVGCVIADVFRKPDSGDGGMVVQNTDQFESSHNMLNDRLGPPTSEPKPKPEPALSTEINQSAQPSEDSDRNQKTSFNP